MKLLTLVAFLFSAVVISGCSPLKPQQEKPQLIGDPEQPYTPDREPKVGDIIHMPTGLYVDEAQMLAAVTDGRIAYVGETHDNPAAHRLQLKVLKATAERYPGKVALGMEMFIPTQQEALDRWVAGELSEPEFLRAANWYQVWSGDFAYYRELLEFCRDNNIPVIGLNAEKKLVRALGRNEPAQLAEELQQQLPDMGFVDNYQQAMVDAIFSGHGPGGGHVDGFKQVQTLWDQTMAENIVNYLNSPEGSGRHLVVLAGGNHVRYGYGIPRRVFRLMPTSYTIVGAREIVIPEEKQDQIMNVTMPKFPMPAYDFVVYAEYEVLASQGVKLGVIFGGDEGQLKVQTILPKSNAAVAGLQVNDLIIQFDGSPVNDIYDIKHQLQQKQPGDQVDLAIDRNGEMVSLPMLFK